MRINIIKGNIPNVSGHIYPTELLEQIVTKINSQKINVGESVSGLFDDPRAISLQKVTHSFKDAKIENGILSVDIDIIPPFKNKFVKESDFKYSLRGIGNVNKKGEVQNYDFITIDII
jgi:hypothetical protein